jgi:hypothetical protein
MNRREFLATSAVPLVALPAHFAADPGHYQKLGLNSYCLRALRWKDTQMLD